MEGKTVQEILSEQHNQTLFAHDKSAQAFSALSTQVGALSTALLAQGAFTSVPVFSGKGNIEDWLAEIDKSSKINGLDDHNTCLLAWSKSRETASLIIGRRLEENPQISWKELRGSLEQNFGQIIDRGQAFTKLTSIRQSREEDISSYIERTMYLADKAYGQDYKDGNNAIVQSQLTSIFMEGLRSPELKLRIYRQNVSKIEEAIQIAKADDLSRKRFPNAFPSPRRVEEPMEIGRHRRGGCFHCGGPHPTRECRRRAMTPPNEGQRPPRNVREIRYTPNYNQNSEEVLREEDRRHKRCFRCHRPGHFFAQCKSAEN